MFDYTPAEFFGSIALALGLLAALVFAFWFTSRYLSLGSIYQYAFEKGRRSIEKREGLPEGFDLNALTSLAWLRGRLSSVEDEVRRVNLSDEALNGTRKRITAEDAVRRVLDGLPETWYIRVGFPLDDDSKG